MIGLFVQAVIGGALVAVLILLAWRLAQRIGLALPRARPKRRHLRCVRPLDFDA